MINYPGSASNLLTGFTPLLTGGGGFGMPSPYAMPQGMSTGAMGTGALPPAMSALPPSPAMPAGQSPAMGGIGGLLGDLSGYGPTSQAMTALPAALSTGAVPPAPGLPLQTAAPQAQAPVAPATQGQPSTEQMLRNLGWTTGPSQFYGGPQGQTQMDLSSWLFPPGPGYNNTGSVGVFSQAQPFNIQTGQFGTAPGAPAPQGRESQR